NQIDDMARQLGMNTAFRKHGNYPVEGIAICSRFPLENVSAVTDRHRRTCAVFADTIVSGRRFTVAVVHLQPTTSLSPDRVMWSDRTRGAEVQLIQQAWVRRGSRPVVIGGDFNQVPVGANYQALTGWLADSLARLGRTQPTLGDGFL